MKNSILTILSFVFILTAGCSKEGLRGEGSIITENRTLLDLDDVETVKVNGETDVHVIYGNDYKLEVKGYGNLVSALRTDIKNHVLRVEFPDVYNIRNNNTEIFLTIPNFPHLDINGSLNADASGNFPDQTSLFLNINGSAKITSGFVKVDNLDVNINGSGNLKIQNIVTKNAKITIGGSGKVKTTVTDKLIANINGSGEILYDGDPLVETHISGSGKVIKP